MDSTSGLIMNKVGRNLFDPVLTDMDTRLNDISIPVTKLARSELINPVMIPIWDNIRQLIWDEVYSEL